MSQTGLSLRGKFSNEYVSRIEKNKPILIEEFISTFCKALNCTRNEFFGIKEHIDDTFIEHELYKRLIKAIGVLPPERQVEEIMKIEVSAKSILKNITK